MGALAVLADEPYVTQIPERFRFSDENPLTLEPYARNKFGDLPPYVEDVILDEVGLTREEWDALVEKNETYAVVGPNRYYSLSRFLGTVRRRKGRAAPSGRVCGDCWGTLAADDYDGSITGRPGTVFVCFCVGC